MVDSMVSENDLTRNGRFSLVDLIYKLYYIFEHYKFHINVKSATDSGNQIFCENLPNAVFLKIIRVKFCTVS